MNTKTPEEMAEEYREDHDECEFAGDAFLAGYKAGKEATLKAQASMDNAIDRMLQRATGRSPWYSVKEALPPSTRQVLCDSFISPMVLANCTDGFELAYYGNYGVGRWTNTLGTEDLNVTHWMPLPTPPKEEK